VDKIEVYFVYSLANFRMKCFLSRNIQKFCFQGNGLFDFDIVYIRTDLDLLSFSIETNDSSVALQENGNFN